MGETVSYQDQLGDRITLSGHPSTIVSLVPSITELLVDLGLRKAIVACTKFCIHPQGLKKEITTVGGTKTVHTERIDALCPDLIIANKEENSKETITHLRQQHNVWVSDIKTLADAYDLITSIGQITNRSERADQIIAEQQSILSSLDPTRGRVAYLIWRDPWMTIGGDTYINDMLEQVGYTNVFKDQSRYPIVDIDMLKSADIDMILLSSEPFPFSEQHMNELQKELPNILVRLVDGEFFSWYGSRLLHMKKYLSNLLIQEPSKN